MLENNMLLGSSHLNYYAFTQLTFNNNIESGTIYGAHLSEQEKNVVNNKKLYKSSRLVSDIKLLFSSGFIKIKNYQFVTGHKAKFFMNNDKINHNDSCLSINDKVNQIFNLFYLFQIEANYTLVFWLYDTQYIIKNVNRYF